MIPHQWLAPSEVSPLLKKENSDVVTTHCFIHREVLISKTLGGEMKKVLDDSTKRLTLSNKDQLTPECIKNYVKTWTKST
jgi:hypothetical protein